MDTIDSKVKTNWKQKAQELGLQVKELTAQLEKVNKENEVNQHDVIKISNQRDVLEKDRGQVVKMLQDRHLKLSLTNHLLNLQRDYLNEMAVINNSLSKISGIVSSMVTFIRHSEELEAEKEEE